MYPERNKAVRGWYVWKNKGDSFYISGPSLPRVGAAIDGKPDGPYDKEKAENLRNELNGRAVTKCN